GGPEQWHPGRGERYSRPLAGREGPLGMQDRPERGPAGSCGGSSGSVGTRRNDHASRSGRSPSGDRYPLRSPRLVRQASRLLRASGSGAAQLAGSCLVLLTRAARRAQQHRHVPALLEGGLLQDTDLRDVLQKPVEQHPPSLGVTLLAAAEHDGHLDLVVLLQEALDVAALGLVVVLGDLRAKLDLADVHLLLALAGLLGLLLLLVLVLRVVEDPADGRLGGRRDLDQIEVFLASALQGVGGRNYSHLLAVLVDQSNLGYADALVDAS